MLSRGGRNARPHDLPAPYPDPFAEPVIAKADLDQPWMVSEVDGSQRVLRLARPTHAHQRREIHRENPAPAGETSPRDESRRAQRRMGDRKSTRLNSSHQIISYAVF